MAVTVNGVAYGVTPTGFQKMRLPEILAGVNADVQAALGVPISSQAASVIGQLNGVYAAREAALWDLAEGIYYSQYPGTAEGANLDNATSYAGVPRDPATKSEVWLTATGIVGTSLPAGAIIKSSVDASAVFAVKTATTLSAASAVFAAIGSPTVLTTGVTYSITVNSVTYSYTTGSGATIAIILSGLASALSGLAGATVTASATELTITFTDQITANTISVSTNLSILRVGTPVLYAATQYGPISANIGELTVIVTSVSGLTSVANHNVVNVGSYTDDDVNLRLGYADRVYLPGRTQVENILAHLLEDVVGVTAARVYENDTPNMDSAGRPPNSIEAVVLGGANIDIANTIRLIKSGGIPTYGSQAVVVTDSQGVEYTINFNRPSLLKVWLKIQITPSGEGTFAADTPQQAQALAAQQVFAIGQDVILQALGGPIFKNLQAIGYVTITGCVSNTTPSSGAYTTANITVDPRSLAQMSADRITVTVL